VLTTSKGVLAASALLLAAAAAGGSASAARADSTGPMNTASASALLPLSPTALAAARTAITVLPHSPRLLNQLAGPGGWKGDLASGTPSASTIPTATAQAAAGALAGLDVAGYQHPVTSRYPNGTPIDWQQVAAARYRFAAIKGTEGDYYVNRWAATDLAKAKVAGLDVSPYHFAIPNVSGGPEQAQYAVQHARYQPGAQTLPLTLDIEYDPYVSSDGTNECYGLSASQMTAWISGFVTAARSLTGQYPIIYTTANWWDTCTGRSTAFGSDPMWVAAYGFSRPPLPAGWATYSYWQYTSGGTVPGVDSPGTTDLDTFSPSAVALIDPGTLSSRPLARVSVPVGSLGALAGETLAWTASGLPPGLRITAAGVLIGVIMNPPSAAVRGALTYRSTVTARNAAGGSSAVTFDWQVTATCPNYLTFGICPGR
jgi:GH25 family lysozyme M1 (1,4-beta-N-acetylmuramidase)